MKRKKGRIPGLAVPEEGYPAHSRGRWGGSAASHHTQDYSSDPCTDTLQFWWFHPVVYRSATFAKHPNPRIYNWNTSNVVKLGSSNGRFNVWIYKLKTLKNDQNQQKLNLWSVLQICGTDPDPIRGSVPLTNGSRSCYFRHWPSRRQ